MVALRKHFLFCIKQMKIQNTWFIRKMSSTRRYNTKPQ
ncbi:hypothetical protein MAR_021796 [Mya arenaria]|uniref:Ribosomal protein L32 n=1 Tax=Mya arenaria TaxID=6604 RepID=A0ABY7E8U3_MYAAR|nr:hypothetical protein MAR_021796 [Mya arenaria]